MRHHNYIWRNLFFTILQPGMVAVVIPWWIAVGLPAYETWNTQSWAGLILFTIGSVITLACIYSFATRGAGTLSPADPTTKLVVSGLYRYSRNPMYVGVSLMLLGDSLFLQKQSVWIYAIVVFAAFNIYVIAFEEPRLRKDFGEDYDTYRKNVRRWL
ncbi:isoprenylcysteine carboxylmethyltransferase family protein [Chryseolinea sp. T2]|uniref:methyltransferase family protein n=1 Tax=Chryseolinea sp. T2 TaxID=3129255 RepID=UPI0030773F89